MLRFFRFVMNFLPSVFINLADRLCFWRAIPAPGHLPSQPPAPSTIKLGNNASIAAAEAWAVDPEDRPIIQAPMDDYHKRMQRPSLFIGFCFAVVGVALQVFPISEPLPVTFHLFCWALELAFATLLVSVCIRHGNQVAAGILGIFFGSMAFMVAITMNLPTPLMMISVAVYAISILVIIFANLFARTP